MKLFSRSRGSRRAILIAGVVSLAAISGLSVAPAWALANPASSHQSHVKHAPRPRPTPALAVPAPAKVTVDPATTAYLVLDDTTAICTPNPACVATVPAAARLLARARAAGALVVYSITVNPGDAVVSGLTPQAGDPVVAARADKFFGTDLDTVLQSHGIKTVVIVGSLTNGAVMYTAFEASVRGYTSVVAEDGTSSSSPAIQHYTLFQLLNAPGFPNATNTPLTPNAVTLSTTRQISFG